MGSLCCRNLQKCNSTFDTMNRELLLIFLDFSRFAEREVVALVPSKVKRLKKKSMPQDSFHFSYTQCEKVPSLQRSSWKPTAKPQKAFADTLKSRQEEKSACKG